MQLYSRATIKWDGDRIEKKVNVIHINNQILELWQLGYMTTSASLSAIWCSDSKHQTTESKGICGICISVDQTIVKNLVILSCRHKKAKRQSLPYRTFVKFGHVVFEMCARTDQGSFRAGTHRNAVPVLFLITGTPFRSFSAYRCKI